MEEGQEVGVRDLIEELDHVDRNCSRLLEALKTALLMGFGKEGSLGEERKFLLQVYKEVTLFEWDENPNGSCI